MRWMGENSIACSRRVASSVIVADIWWLGLVSVDVSKPLLRGNGCVFVLVHTKPIKGVNDCFLLSRRTRTETTETSGPGDFCEFKTAHLRCILAERSLGNDNHRADDFQYVLFRC